jgi:hypothetical protein
MKYFELIVNVQSFERINKGPHGEAIHGYKILLTVALDNKAIESEFKLKKTVSSHIYLYNAQGRLRYYTSPDEGILFAILTTSPSISGHHSNAASLLHLSSNTCITMHSLQHLQHYAL